MDRDGDDSPAARKKVARGDGPRAAKMSKYSDDEYEEDFEKDDDIDVKRGRKWKYIVGEILEEGGLDTLQRDFLWKPFGVRWPHSDNKIEKP